MNHRHFTLARMMAVILLCAADFAALRGDEMLLIFLPILNVGLALLVLRRGKPRPFWLGFEVIGWSIVIAVAARPEFLSELVWFQMNLLPDVVVDWFVEGSHGRRGDAFFTLSFFSLPMLALASIRWDLGGRDGPLEE